MLNLTSTATYKVMEPHCVGLIFALKELMSNVLKKVYFVT